MKIEFYRDENGMICVVGTTYSFLDKVDFDDFARTNGWEVEEVEAPEVIDYNGLVW